MAQEFQRRVFLARRALTKSHDPGKWGPAAAGTVEEGETYEQNIVKEIFEELGLKDVQLQLGPKQFVQGTWTFFDQWFFATVDKEAKDFVISKDEVEEVAWFSSARYRKEILKNPDAFIASMKNLPKEFLS